MLVLHRFSEKQNVNLRDCLSQLNKIETDKMYFEILKKWKNNCFVVSLGRLTEKLPLYFRSLKIKTNRTILSYFILNMEFCSIQDRIVYEHKI